MKVFWLLIIISVIISVTKFSWDINKRERGEGGGSLCRADIATRQLNTLDRKGQEIKPVTDSSGQFYQTGLTVSGPLDLPIIDGDHPPGTHTVLTDWRPGGVKGQEALSRVKVDSYGGKEGGENGSDTPRPEKPSGPP